MSDVIPADVRREFRRQARALAEQARKEGQREGYAQRERELTAGLEFVSKSLNLPEWVFRKATAGLVLKEVKPGVHRWVNPNSNEEHEHHPETGQHAGAAATVADMPPEVQAKAHGVFGRIKDRVQQFMIDHATTVFRVEKAFKILDALFTTPEDVAKYPWLAGKFSNPDGVTGDQIRDATGVPGHLAARLGALALMKAWSAAKSAIGMQKAIPDEDTTIAGEFLAGLVDIVREGLGLSAMDDAQRQEVADGVAKLIGGSGDESALDQPDSPDLLHDLTDVVLELVQEAKEAGDDPQPILQVFRELANDPAALAAALSDGGEIPPEDVGKAILGVILKGGERAPKGGVDIGGKHYRGGMFIPGHAIANASPEEKKKLREKKEAQAEGKDPATVGESGAEPPATASDPRTEHANNHKSLARHFSKVADLKAKLTAEHLNDLADHLASEHTTVAQIKELRDLVKGAGAGRAKIYGADATGKRGVKRTMREKLSQHIRDRVLSMRSEEMGFDPDEMRAAVGESQNLSGESQNLSGESQNLSGESQNSQGVFPDSPKTTATVETPKRSLTEPTEHEAAARKQWSNDQLQGEERPEWYQDHPLWVDDDGYPIGSVKGRSVQTNATFSRVSPPPPTNSTFEKTPEQERDQAIQSITADLAKQAIRSGGLVKIHDIEDRLRERFPDMTRGEFFRHMNRMEKRDAIHMQENSEAWLEPRSKDMLHSTRGLLGYVQLPPGVKPPAAPATPEPSATPTRGNAGAGVPERLAGAIQYATELRDGTHSARAVEDGLREHLGRLSTAEVSEVLKHFGHPTFGTKKQKIDRLIQSHIGIQASRQRSDQIRGEPTKPFDSPPAAATTPAPSATPTGEQPPEPGFTGEDSLGRQWVDGKLVAKQEEPTDGEIANPQSETGDGVRRPDGGGDDSGGAPRTAGERGAEPARPRIVTARAEHTKSADPGLVPESVRQHLNEAQQQGAALAIDAMTKHGGFLLADGTGVGKTRQQLAVAKHWIDKGKKVVIVSPAEVIKPDWGKGKMSGSFAHDSEAMGISAKLTKGDKPIAPGAVHVTTYNELGKLKNQIDKDTVLILDESHFLKNRESARHKHGKEAMQKAHAVMYATATPGDKPLHIAHLFRANVFGNEGQTKTFERLGMRLVDQHIGGGEYRKVWQIDPKVGYGEAMRRMSGLFDQLTKDGLMVKRELSMDGVNVGMDHASLTPEQHDEINRVYRETLAKTGGGDPEEYQRIRDQLHEAKSRMRLIGEDIRRTREGDAGYRASDLPAMQERLQSASDEVGRLNSQLSGMSSGRGNKAVALMAARLHQEPMKIPHTVGIVQEELAAGRSPVVFVGRVNDIAEDQEGGEDTDNDVRSHGTAAALKKALIAAGIPESDIGELHGGATKTAAQKKKAMEQFQANKTKVIIATIQSGGTGINLDDTTGTRPRTMVMVTPPFTANDMAQAVGRVHRLNTKSNSRIRGVLADTEIDHWNAGLLKDKFRALGAIAGGESTRGAGAIGHDVSDTSNEPYEWGQSVIPIPKVRVATPYAHKDIAAQHGGRPVKTDAGWVTEFPSQEHHDRYKAAVAPKTPPASSSSSSSSTPKYKRVETRYGTRHVHTFSPGRGYWDHVHKNRPDYISVRENPSTNRWEVSVWGKDDAEVEKNLADLRRRGGL